MPKIVVLFHHGDLDELMDHQQDRAELLDIQLGQMVGDALDQFLGVGHVGVLLVFFVVGFIVPAPWEGVNKQMWIPVLFI